MWATGLLHATINRKPTSKRFGKLPMKFFLIVFIIVAPRIYIVVGSREVELPSAMSVQVMLTPACSHFPSLRHVLRCRYESHDTRR